MGLSLLRWLDFQEYNKEDYCSELFASCKRMKYVRITREQVQFPCNHIMEKDNTFKGSEKHNHLTYSEQTKSNCWLDILITSSVHLEFQP